MDHPQPAPDEESLTLCCGGRKCPTITHNSGENASYRLSDDEEGATPVQMSPDQFEELIRWGAKRLGLSISE